MGTHVLPHPKEDETLQTSKRIDRRELIAGSAAGAAALAIAAVPTVAGSSDLAQVIEAHRVAFQRYRTRLGELTEIEDALSDARHKNPATSQERAIGALEEAEASIVARERDAGLPEAQAAVRETQQVELDARVRLTLAVPANAEEAKVKAQYIKASTPFRDGWCSEEDFVRAMIDRVGEHRA